MSDTTPAPEIDFKLLSLDALKRLAQRAPAAATRSAAARALKARTEVSALPSTPKSAKVVLGTSEWGTPLPEIQVTSPASNARREIRATLFHLAGRVEQALSETTELWEIGVRFDGDSGGAVYVELMDASKPEQQRAMTLLQQVLQTVGDLTTKRGWGGARNKRTTQPPEGPVDDAPTESGAESEDAGEPAPEPQEAIQVATTVPVPAASGDWKEERRRWRQLAGPLHADSEQAILDLALQQRALPAIAEAVLRGGKGSAEYFRWLVTQLPTLLSQGANGHAEV